MGRQANSASAAKGRRSGAVVGRVRGRAGVVVGEGASMVMEAATGPLTGAPCVGTLTPAVRQVT